jgi:hypothetical protein
MPAKKTSEIAAGNGSARGTNGMTCPTSKVGYGSRKSAEAEVNRIGDAHIIAYQCEECGKWHVGHEEVRAKVRDGHANRAAAHLEAMETRPPASTVQIKLPELDIRLTDLYLIGETPLICHAWSEKAKKMILDKQTGVANAGREHKDPEQDFRDSLYDFPGGGYGFPAIAFKSSAVSACTSLGRAAITKVAARQAFHVMADDPMTGLVRLVGTPKMRDDMVRVGMGTADIRFRGQFFPWACNLRIRYNARVLSFEQIANIFNTAGFAVGVGEWRSEKDGGYGQYRVGNKPA